MAGFRGVADVEARNQADGIGGGASILAIDNIALPVLGVHDGAGEVALDGGLVWQRGNPSHPRVHAQEGIIDIVCDNGLGPPPARMVGAGRAEEHREIEGPGIPVRILGEDGGGPGLRMLAIQVEGIDILNPLEVVPWVGRAQVMVASLLEVVAIVVLRIHEKVHARLLQAVQT